MGALLYVLIGIAIVNVLAVLIVSRLGRRLFTHDARVELVARRLKRVRPRADAPRPSPRQRRRPRARG